MPSSSSFAAGASTPGLRGLRLATWNMGLAQADSFKKNNIIDQHLNTAASNLALLLDNVDMVCMNEIHSQHHGQLDRLLDRHPKIAFIGFSLGDAV